MYLFKTSTPVESKVCPGVTFTVKKMTEDRRDILRAALAIPVSKLELRGEELRSLVGRTDAEADTKRATILSECAQIEGGELAGIKITWGLKAIDGLCIDADDNKATVGEWKKWPSELVGEAIELINSASGLSVLEVKKSEPGFTSGEAEPEATNDTTAQSASASESTSPETV